MNNSVMLYRIFIQWESGKSTSYPAQVWDKKDLSRFIRGVVASNTTIYPLACVTVWCGDYCGCDCLEYIPYLDKYVVYHNCDNGRIKIDAGIYAEYTSNYNLYLVKIQLN